MGGGVWLLLRFMKTLSHPNFQELTTKIMLSAGWADMISIQIINIKTF